MRVWGAIYGAVTLVIWSLVFLRTLTMLRNGQIFESPCIEELDIGNANAKKAAESEKDKQRVNVTVYEDARENGRGNGHASGFENGISTRGLVSSQSM